MARAKKASTEFTLTTPPPRFDAVKAFPELAALARACVRLHPRRAPDGPIDASKLGGTFLWPRDEPWPAYDEARVCRLCQELEFCKRDCGGVKIDRLGLDSARFALAQLDCGASDHAWNY